MKITSPLKYLSLLAIISLSTSFVHAESQAELKAKAKISEEAARETALKEVPGGTVENLEMEVKKGVLVYSFDIKGANKVEEVDIDAETGKITEEHKETEAAVQEKEKEEGKK
jgi:uncharacterized membrane protein YkoI